MATQKEKFNLYKNQISHTNFKSFSNQRSDTASKLSSLNSSLPIFFFRFLSLYQFFSSLPNFFFFTSFQSHLIRHSGTGCTFKDTQSALRHLRHSESTQALWYWEGTQTVLGRHLGNWAPGEHSESTRALEVLRNSQS